MVVGCACAMMQWRWAGTYSSLMAPIGIHIQVCSWWGVHVHRKTNLASGGLCSSSLFTLFMLFLLKSCRQRQQLSVCVSCALCCCCGCCGAAEPASREATAASCCSSCLHEEQGGIHSETRLSGGSTASCKHGRPGAIAAA